MVSVAGNEADPSREDGYPNLGWLRREVNTSWRAGLARGRSVGGGRRQFVSQTILPAISLPGDPQRAGQRAVISRSPPGAAMAAAAQAMIAPSAPFRLSEQAPEVRGDVEVRLDDPIGEVA